MTLSAAELASLIVALMSAFGAVLSYVTSSRSTEVERIKTNLGALQELTRTLQAQLDDERERRAKLEQMVVDRDAIIARLQRDLDAAHGQIRELQGRAALMPTLQQQIAERDRLIEQLRGELAAFRGAPHA